MTPTACGLITAPIPDIYSEAPQVAEDRVFERSIFSLIQPTGGRLRRPPDKGGRESLGILRDSAPRPPW
jgi:hypothetical protein